MGSRDESSLRGRFTGLACHNAVMFLPAFRLNYLAGGLHPWGYHLVNVLLHCLACGLFGQLCAQLLGAASPAAWLGSLLFAVHPVHTEAVAGVVGTR
ncbi:Transmembrane and TPR repeat-containing protein 2 [Amphibalanus amphitrite]|uniref:Transmembrane and TPR repeat-containing protein 2 n=1 Tax=Amphibalanus amphitrite TaxID=1232801 RepID=A0A6A4X5I7_AMPAM|nr:Transmembrane and TPR repeat-containing protein 2 [Amphibalanus amphitrite]